MKAVCIFHTRQRSSALVTNFFERSEDVDRKYAIGETTMLGRLFLTGVLQPQRMVLRDDGRAWAIEAFVPVCRVVGRVSREDTH